MCEASPLESEMRNKDLRMSRIYHIRILSQCNHSPHPIDAKPDFFLGLCLEK